MKKPISLDLRDFKHVKSDKHTTTLQHKAGHQLVLAHSALSPVAREQIKALSKISQQAMTQPQAQEQGYVQAQLHANGGKVHEVTNKQIEVAKKLYPPLSPSEQQKRDEKNRLQDQYMKHLPKMAEGGETKEPPKPEEKTTSQEGLDNDLPASETTPLVRWEFARGGNAGEARKELFGSSSAPANKEMRAKHIAHIKDFARRAFGIDMQPSGGKINQKTGQRRDESPEVGVDKPDWRSGNLESQWNPDAMVHELAHLMLMPKGIGLKDAQQLMDKQYADVQKQYGYMKQKRSHHEIQPMAVENLIRRHLGLPANTNSVPVKPGDAPRTAVEDNAVVGNRIKKGEKQVDLIRQSAFLTPENRQRVEHIMSGKLKFHPEQGWQENPDAMGAKVRMAQEQAQGAPSSVMAEGGKVKEQPSLDYEQIRKEKREMNSREANRPVKGGNFQRYAEGSDDVQPNDQPPARLRAPQDPTDIGNVQETISPGQAPSPLPDKPEDDPQYHALLSLAKMRQRQGQTISQYDPATGQSHDVEVNGQIGAGPKPEETAAADLQRNRDVNEHPERHSLVERTASKAQQQEIAPNLRTQQFYPDASPTAPDVASQPIEQDDGGETNQDMYDKIHRAPDTFGQSDQSTQAPQAPQNQSPQGQTPAPPDDSQGVATTPKTMAERYKENMDELLGHNANFISDNAAGHIQPKTMEQMWQFKNTYDDKGNVTGMEKRGTLGKIGMLFSAMLGGAGAGLAHQNNMFLQQMNNEINNDLTAQQNSAGNAQNFFRVNQQGLANQAGIEDTAVGIRSKAQALAWDQMSYHAFDTLAKQVQDMPEGPDKVKAQQTLMLTGAALQKERTSVFGKAAAAAAQSQAFGPQSSITPSGQPVTPEEKEAAWSRANIGLSIANPQLAADLASKHIPYMDGQASRPVPEPVRQQLTAMNTLDMKGRELLAYAKKYNVGRQMQMNPAELAALWKVGNQKAQEMVTMYNNSIQGGVLTAGRLAWLDSQIKNPANAFQNALGEMEKVGEVVNSNATRRDQLLRGPEVGWVPASRPGTAIQQEVSTPPQQDMIPLISPSGKPVKAPTKNLQQLIRMGYRQR